VAVSGDYSDHTLTTLSQSASAESKPHECLHPGSSARPDWAPFSRAAVTREKMVSPSTEFFTACRSSLKLVCSTLASFWVLSNYVLTRNSQDHRGGQTPVHRQRSRRRRHVGIRSILDCTSACVRMLESYQLYIVSLD
jgi:hypothetical protein